MTGGKRTSPTGDLLAEAILSRSQFSVSTGKPEPCRPHLRHTCVPRFPLYGATTSHGVLLAVEMTSTELGLIANALSATTRVFKTRQHSGMASLCRRGVVGGMTLSIACATAGCSNDSAVCPSRAVDHTITVDLTALASRTPITVRGCVAHSPCVHEAVDSRDGWLAVFSYLPDPELTHRAIRHVHVHLVISRAGQRMAAEALSVPVLEHGTSRCGNYGGPGVIDVSPTGKPSVVRPTLQS